ncbi:hypothetical protein BLX87_11100, partial [Bacillus sp. VT-16-64]
MSLIILIYGTEQYEIELDLVEMNNQLVMTVESNANDNYEQHNVVRRLCFFLKERATTNPTPLPLHDALPITQNRTKEPLACGGGGLGGANFSPPPKFRSPPGGNFRWLLKFLSPLLKRDMRNQLIFFTTISPKPRL